jgi:hypothetical protein
LTVQVNAIRDVPGTRFTIERALTSWNVMPLNSGVSNVLVTTSVPKSAGAALAAVSLRLFQRMGASCVAVQENRTSVRTLSVNPVRALGRLDDWVGARPAPGRTTA